MGILDRIILTIYTFLLAFLSLGVILLALNLISLELVWTSISMIRGQWEAALIGLLFFMVSIRLLLAGIRSRRNKGTIAHHTAIGDVHITLEAVKNLVEKTARHPPPARRGYGRRTAPPRPSLRTRDGPRSLSRTCSCPSRWDP